MGLLSSSYLGIGVSVAGNVLISVSLNTQKLAHKRLAERGDGSLAGLTEWKNDSSDGNTAQASERTPLLNSHASGSHGARSSLSKTNRVQVYAVSPTDANNQSQEDPHRETGIANGVQVTQKLAHPEAVIRELAESGTPVTVQDTKTGRLRRKWLSIRRNPSEEGHSQARHQQGSSRNKTPTLMPRDPALRERSREGTGAKHRSKRSGGTGRRRNSTQRDTAAYVYKSKLWWIGILLMSIGELGNFTSYAFAPASVVAPLGTVALIANCFIAPCMLHEQFRKRDLLGIALSILGAVTVVLTSKSENKSLKPHQFIEAVKQTAFIVYAFVTLGLIILFGAISRTRLEDKYLAIDIALCSLCGGFTVLSVKAFSSFLTQGFVDCFKQWLTYPVLAVLAVTALLQIIFLNRALQRFESRVVVPTQFVGFTISAITGSAILYRDFEDVDIKRVLAFFLGCILVFIGVVILTRSTDDDESDKTAASSEEEGSGLQNDSQISNISSNAAAHELQGVTLTSRPPIPSDTTASTTDAALQLSPPIMRAGPGLRKYRSTGGLPRLRGVGAPPNTGQVALATPIKSVRPPSLTATKLFSPGYLLIAGSGFGNLSTSSDGGSDSEYGDGDTQPTIDEDDLESGLRGGSESQEEDDGTQRSAAPTPLEGLELGESGQLPSGETEEDYEPMTRSAIMRRSGTV